MKNGYSFRQYGAKLLFASLLWIFTQGANAACASGSITLKAPLFTVSYDSATRLLTYIKQVGTVTKKAVQRQDCVSYTTYTISGTSGLPYANGTQLFVSGKNNFNSPTPAAIYVTVNNGAINTTFTASGMYSGINSDALTLYNGSIMAFRVKQPWN